MLHNEVNLAALLNSLTASISAFVEHRAHGTGELDSLEGYFLGHQEVPEEGGKVRKKVTFGRILPLILEGPRIRSCRKFPISVLLRYTWK